MRREAAGKGGLAVEIEVTDPWAPVCFCRGGANGMETVAWFSSFWVASFSSFQVAGLDHFDWLD
jgi:hypothetical protein